MNDKFCHDGNNVPECDWDGGDCCDNEQIGWNDQCEDCECLVCPEPAKVDNTYCDDFNNIAACNWDGRDCCTPEYPDWNKFCQECKCLDPAQTCKKTDWLGDYYCDDELNHEACGWDGGDCCGNPGDISKWHHYCTSCQCLDPKYEGCPNRALMNDGFCNDLNNIPQCDWDGGDCCFNGNVGWDNYCGACECLDPDPDPCPKPAWKIGNGKCDDAQNIEVCDWDGGDCCNNENPGWNDYCDDCKCLDPEFNSN